MEAFIKERFNQNILQEAINRFDGDAETATELDGFENFLYEFQRNKKASIMRIAHSSRRSKELIQGELDWINFLYDHNINVPKAFFSINNQFVEIIDDEHRDQFLSTCFSKINGQPPWESGWTDEGYRNFGRLIGKMHQATKQYQPTHAGCQRPIWEDPIIQDVERNLPKTETRIRDIYRTYYTHACSLPKEKDSYGLIHFDANPSNLLIDDHGVITLIDFDDCCYSWFVNDLAIILFYMVMGEEDVTGFIEHFMKHFLDGYRSEHKLDAKWLKEIPTFLKLREIDMYALIVRDFGAETDDPWCRRFLDGRKQRIEQDVPYFDYDFTKLAEYL
jgi:amicoumacin kinase